MGFGLIIEVFVICKTKKVLISLERDEVSKLHYISLNHLNRRKVNQDHI